MSPKRKVRRRAFLSLAVICLIGETYLYLDSYYLRSARTVGNGHDPRWRVIDFNSRPASESEIYDVAEVPVIRKISEVGPRRLRFEFAPAIRTTGWTVVEGPERTVVARGPFPEIPFPEALHDGDYELVPEGLRLPKEIRISIQFYPKENYRRAGLSWPDNYWVKRASVPFGLETPRPAAEWAGFSEADPDLAEARRILGGRLDPTASALERSEAVFRFVMSELKDSGGTPSDAVQSASPLETYRLLTSGRDKGFCENKALVYFLFANAARVPTRLVDLAGKLGPLKLSGHYFCESFILEEGGWAYVDPQSGIANIRDVRGGLVNSIELQRALKTAAFETCVLRTYDSSSGSLVSVRAEGRAGSLENYFTGDGVLAFPFGYENKPGFARVWHFLTRSTLLYARSALPRIYLWKYIFLFGFVISAGLAAARVRGRSPGP